jgi:ABC-type glycerol-3-phosphate transport system substrate-binding protein
MISNGTSLSRRQFLGLMGGMVSLAALAGCAALGAAPQTGDEAAAPAAERRELVFWGHDQHPIDLAAEGFVEKYPEISWVSPHPADRVEKLVAKMAADSGAPDLFWAEATDAQDWGCNELLTDLTHHLKPEIDQYHPAKVAETLIAKTGKYVGWPGDLGVSGWYYRQDKLEAAGMGDVDFEALTWSDFVRMAGELAQQGLNSFCFPADGWSALFMFVLHQVGGTAISQDGQHLTVGDEKGVAAMQIVKNLWDAGRTENPDQPAGLEVAWWSPPYWAALREGTLIGDFAAAWAKGFWEANLQDAEDPGAFGNWRIAKFPGGEGIQYRTGIWGGPQLINPKASANTQDALLFMQYALGSVEGAARCGEWGIIPAYRPYLESDEFLSQRSPVFGDWAFCEFWAEQEKELSPEYFRPAGWGTVEVIVGKEMVPILLDEYGVEEGMARLVELATPDFERMRCV